MNRTATAIIYGALAAVAAAVQAPAAPPQPNLAGRWELNAQQSEWPRDEVPIPTGGAPAGFGGLGGYGVGGTTGATGGGYRGGGTNRGGSGGGGVLKPATRDEIQRIMQAPRVLLIVQDASQVRITDDQGRTTVLKPDGAKVKDTLDGASVERTTTWDGRTLVTTMKLADGLKATQTFTKASEGLQLLVFTKTEGGGLARPVEVRRVYDQALQ